MVPVCTGGKRLLQSAHNLLGTAQRVLHDVQWHRQASDQRFSASVLALDTAVLMPALAPLQYCSTAPVRKREKRFEELFM